MDNVSTTLGMEDGASEVECLLVEPHGEHVSVDSVMRIHEKITHKAVCVKEVSSVALSNTGIAHEGDDILSEEVLDAMHTGTKGGYFLLQNDFCNLGEDYLSGVEFAESITSLDHGSMDLHASVLDGSIVTSSGDTGVPWKSDCMRVMEVPGLQNDQLSISSYEFNEIPSCHEGESLVQKQSSKGPKSTALGNIGKFSDAWSSCSFQDVLSDMHDGSLFPSGEIFCSLEILQNEERGHMGLDLGNHVIHGQDSLAVTAARVSQTDALTALKRPRKPTQRYLDELAGTLSKHPTRKRKFSSFASKEKYLELNDHRKCHMKARAITLPTEESSVRPIQVPFGTVVQKESQKNHAFDMVPKRYVMVESKECCPTQENQNKGNYNLTPVRRKRRDDFTMAVLQKKMADCVAEAHTTEMDDYVSEAHLMKRENYVTRARLRERDNYVTGNRLKRCDDHFVVAARKKKRDDCTHTMNPKRRHVHVAVTLQKRDVSFRVARPKQKKDSYSTESLDEVIHRRKHHRVWTISEVRKLIDGVSQYGVGRWSRIKKLFFPTSAHRTSVDIKDKWRNLLKASGIQEQNKRQGEKRRNMAWRPLPKPILRRVCDLANRYPYPKGQKPKIAHFHHISSDGGADITLREYMRMKKSINGS